MAHCLLTHCLLSPVVLTAAIYFPLYPYCRSNAKGRGTADGWAKHKPMDDEELLFKQVQLTAAATPGSTSWVCALELGGGAMPCEGVRSLSASVFCLSLCNSCTPPIPCADRNSVYAYNWNSVVRKILDDPAYAPWFLKFKPVGPWYSHKCDSANASLCSDYYHSQEQSPGFPHGDGDCAAPACDCGANPCGFYVWNASSTAVINGQTFRDWFIDSYSAFCGIAASCAPTGALKRAPLTPFSLTPSHPNTRPPVLNAVGAAPITSGFFWDDVWNIECNIHDQVPQTCEDMGLTAADLAQLTADYQANMAALRDRILSIGKFAWQLLWTGGPPDNIGSCGAYPQVTQKTCAADLRALCNATSAPQVRAMMYGLSGSPEARNPDLMQDLASFLLIRGPFAWLGWGWRGCSVDYYFPPEFHSDYGTPAALCSETAPSSGVFVRQFDKSTVQMDCNTWTPTITFK